MLYGAGLMGYVMAGIGSYRVPVLLILLIFWKNAVGYEGWSSHAVQYNQNWPVHKILSPRVAQSSVLEAPVTGSIPLEEVASNGLAWKRPNASRSRFSLSQYVKGGTSSSYVSMSPTQSAPSSSVSASLVLPLNQQSLDSNTSLLQLQGSFSSSIQDIANQSGLQLGETSSPLSAQSNTSTGSSASSLSEVTYTSQGSYGPQLAGGSSQLVSGLLPQSPSTASQNIPVSSVYTTLAASPLGVSQSTSGLSSYSQNTSGSQSRVGTQLSLSSSFQPQGTISQYAPTFSLGANVPMSSQYYPATQSGSSQSLSQSSQWQPSTSRTKGFQPSSTATSLSSSPSQGSKAPSGFSTLSSAASPGQFSPMQAGSGRYSGLSSQSQSASSQYSPGSPASAKRGSSLLDVSSQATRDQGSYNVYTSSPTQGTGAQLAGSSHYVPMQTGSTFTDGSSLQLQGTSSQYAPAALDAKVPVYSPAAPSGSSLSLSQPSQLNPPTSRWSQGFQASGTVASQGFQTSGTATSQSSSPSQGSKAPSRFSTLSSAASPGQFSPMQAGSGRYSGLSSQSQSASSQYSPGSPASAKRGSSLLDVSSQATRDQGSYNVYTSSPTLGTGAQLAGSSHYVPMQTGSTFTDGSSLQLQGTSSQYAPAALVAKVPVYNQAAPSGSSSLNRPSQWQPSTSRLSQGFQSSGTVASQGFQTSGIATSLSSSPSQGSKAPSRFSTLTSAASPGQFSPMQAGSGRYSGLSSQSQSASSQYSPGSPASAKRGSSLLDVSSQATRDQGSYNVYTSSPTPGTGAQLAGSSHYVPMQTGSTFTDGSSLQLQGTSSQYAPAASVAKVPVYNQAAPSGSSSLNRPSQWQPSTSRLSQGFQTSGTATSLSSSPSQGSKAPSRFSTLTSAASPGQFSPMQTGSTFTDGSSLQLQGTSSQYAPVASVAKVPVYDQAAPSGSSLSLSQLSQLKPSTSRWSQGFQAPGTAVSQSSSSPQTSQLSTGSSFMPALSPPVNSVAQSSQPSMLSFQAASGSVIRRQKSPGLFASVQRPMGSVTSSLGSNVQAASQGMFSGQSSDSTSVISSRYSSTYIQKPSGYSRPSQSTSASGRYFSSVKG